MTEDDPGRHDGVVVDVGKSGTRCWWRGERIEAAGLAPEDAARPGAGARLADAVTAGWRGHHTAVDGADHVTDVAIGSTFIPSPTELVETGTGLRRLWPRARIGVVDDGLLAHAAALGCPGVVASVGTGTIVVGLDPAGGFVRADGWGPDLGDRGSAWAIGQAGVRAVCRWLDGLGPDTALVPRLADYLGIRLDHAMATELLSAPDRVRRIAGFAAEVAIATPDDPVARRILATAADDLADTVTAVADRIGVRRFALVGGMATADGYRNLVEERCRDRDLSVRRPGALADLAATTLLRPPYRDVGAWIVDPDGTVTTGGIDRMREDADARRLARETARRERR